MIKKKVPGKKIRGKVVNTVKENQGRPIDISVNGIAYKFADGVVTDVPEEVVEAIKDAVEWIVPQKAKDNNLDRGEVYKKIPYRRYEFFPEYVAAPKGKTAKVMEELQNDDILSELGADA